MDNTFVENLNIRQVAQQDHLEVNRIFISFKMEEAVFVLVLINKNNQFKPEYVAHGNCCFCEPKEEIECKKLTPYMNEIFERLIEFPSIRLYWLFLEKSS